MPLSVNGLGSLDLLLRSDMLLNDLWGSLCADLGGVGLAVTLEELLDALCDAGHCDWIGSVGGKGGM